MKRFLRSTYLRLLQPGLFLVGSAFGATTVVIEELQIERLPSGLTSGLHCNPLMALATVVMLRATPLVALGVLLAHTRLSPWLIALAAAWYSIGWVLAASIIRPVLLGEYWLPCSAHYWLLELLLVDSACVAVFSLTSMGAAIMWRRAVASYAWVPRSDRPIIEPPPLQSWQSSPPIFDWAASAAQHSQRAISAWPRILLTLAALVVTAEAVIVRNDISRWRADPFVAVLRMGWEETGGFVMPLTYPNGTPTGARGAMLRTQRPGGEIIMLAYDRNAQGSSPSMQLQVHYERPSMFGQSFEGSSPFILCNLDKEQAQWVLLNGVPQPLIDCLCGGATPVNLVPSPQAHPPAIWIDPVPFIAQGPSPQR